jgi:hypothetical protein
MDISFDLLLMLVLTIFARALFLKPPQFISHYLELEMLAVVRPPSSTPVLPLAFLNQDKDGGAFAAVQSFSRCFFREAARELPCACHFSLCANKCNTPPITRNFNHLKLSFRNHSHFLERM